MPIRTLLTVAVTTLTLAGCATADDTTEPAPAAETQAPSEPTEPAVTEPAEETPAAPEGTAELVEYGFGQDGDYTWVTSLVSNTGLVGEFATVQFNLYDEAGTLLASTDQVEGFTTAEGLTALGTQVDTVDMTVASVEATLAVSDYGMSGTDAVDQVPPVDGQPTADGWAFTLTNTTDTDWTDLRVGIVCRDGGGQIIGGTSEFPSLVPAGGQHLLDTIVMVSPAEGTTCTAYPQAQPPMG